jgi:hypothetical protein
MQQGTDQEGFEPAKTAGVKNIDISIITLIKRL